MPPDNPAKGLDTLHQLRNNPSGMHDVEFYQSIAQELPDSKVIHSILYTHRSVMDDGLTVDEEVANRNISGISLIPRCYRTVPMW